VINFESEQQVLWMAGMDRYSEQFVDYELAWGPGTAKVLRRILIEQRKLSDPARVLAFGQPGLEASYEGAITADEVIPEELRIRLRKSGRQNVVLFITGFHLANYTPRDLLMAGDIVRQDDPDFHAKISEAVRGVENAVRFRQAWIEMVLRAARENPDSLIVVKGHPIEAEQLREQGAKRPYDAFQGIPNLVHFFDDVSVGDLLPHCGLFLHYGSTCASEAFLLGVPSVFVASQEIYGAVSSPSPYDYTDLGWPSSWHVDVTDGADLVHRHLTSGLPSGEGNEKMSKVMRDVFAVTREHMARERKYQPSRDIALFLLALDGRSPQQVPLRDPYLQEAISACGREMVDHCVDPILRDGYCQRLGL